MHEESHASSGQQSPVPPLLYGTENLRRLAAEINKNQDAVVLFGTDNRPEVRQKALEILARAEVETGLLTNAATGFHKERGICVLVFRDPARTTRAEVLEELRHLEYARLGKWNESLPGLLSALQLRELDAAAHFYHLWRDGKITKSEFEATIDNLAHHLGSRQQPLTPAQALTILEGLMS